LANRKHIDTVATGANHAKRFPGWLPPVFHAGIALVLFFPFVFGGAGQMIYGTDALLGYVGRALFHDAVLELGRLPRWQPEVLGGVPYLEASSAGPAIYPPSLLLSLTMDLHRAVGWKLILHVAAAGPLMYGWMRCLRVSRPAALLAGTAYMLAPVFVSLTFAGHDGKMIVASLTPLLFWMTERHFARPRPAAFAGIALTVAAAILSPHFQMAFFLFCGAGAYAIFRTVQVHRAEGRPEAGSAGVRGRPGARAARRFGLFMGAAVAGAAIAGPQLAPAFEHITTMSRRLAQSDAEGMAARDWSSSWNLHWEETAGLVVPEFVGYDVPNAEWTRGTYWGRNLFKLNTEYVGIVAMLLAAVALFGSVARRARRDLHWFFAGLAALALLFALGDNTFVWIAIYEVVPGINLFRAPSMIMFLFGFAVCTLAGLGLDRVLARREANPADPGPERREDRAMVRTALLGGGLMVVVAALASAGVLTDLFTAVFGLTPGREIRLAAAQPHIETGAWIAAFLAAVVAGLVWARSRTRVSPGVFAVAVLTIIVVDGFRINRPFIQMMDHGSWAAPDANTRQVLERERQLGGGEPYRMLSLRGGGQDLMPALHGIELAGGNHPNDLAYYRELAGMEGSGRPANLLSSQSIGRLLNIKYLLWPDHQLGNSGDQGIVSRTETADGSPYETVLQLPALARARLLANAVVKSDGEAVDYMLSTDFDPAGEVVLAGPPPVDLDGGPVTGAVTWQERGPDRIVLDVESDRPALLVVADNWYPWWRARVNGRDQPVLRAYHALRAVPVGAGVSEVVMWYESTTMAVATGVSLATLSGLAAAAGLAGFRRRRRPVVSESAGASGLPSE